MSVPDPTRRFFGGLLMGVGSLAMALCGACSAFALIFVVPALVSLIGGLFSGKGTNDDYALVFVQSFTLFGVVPILAGWGLFLVGRRLRGDAPPRKRRAPPPGPDVP